MACFTLCDGKDRPQGNEVERTRGEARRGERKERGGGVGRDGGGGTGG